LNNFHRKFKVNICIVLHFLCIFIMQREFRTIHELNFFFNALLNVNNFVGWTLFFFRFFSRYDAIVYDFLMFGILIKKIKSIEIKSVFIAF